MRLVPAFLLLVVATPAFAGDPELPPPLNLVEKRQELFGAYPEFPVENARSALRRHGAEIQRFEQMVIGGWQQEILERCRQVKAFESFVNKRNRNGELSPNQYAQHLEDIQSEREDCDTRYKETSAFWQLEADLRTMNSERFEQLRTAEVECSRNDECRTR